MWQQNYYFAGGSLAYLGADCGRAAADALLSPRRSGGRRPGSRRWRRSASAGVVALVFVRMPVQQAVAATLNGAAFGLFPISWIVFSSILLYRLAVDTGKFEIIRDSIGALTGDRRLQLLLIAFSFSAFIEGAAGFGSPVAMSAAMMAGLGFPPFYAALLCLIGNTAPVAFGSIGIPIVTLTQITGLPMQALSAMTGAAVDRRPGGARLPSGADGGRHEHARRLACGRRLRGHVRRNAVSGVELHRSRADRDPRVARVTQRDGAAVEDLEAVAHLPARGRRQRGAARRAAWRRCDIPGVDAVPAPRHLRADLGVQADEGLARRHDDDDDSRAVAAQHDSAHAAGDGATRTVRGPVRLQLVERRGNGVRAGGRRGGGGAASAAPAIRLHLQGDASPAGAADGRPSRPCWRWRS